MKKKILAVDDSRMMLRIISEAVQASDYEPITASDGKMALEVLKENVDDVELILLDWNMPTMNGLETLRAIKDNKDYCHIPVMMVTTENENKNVVQAIEAGAQHYLTKPFNQQDLVTRIMECLGKGY